MHMLRRDPCSSDNAEVVLGTEILPKLMQNITKDFCDWDSHGRGKIKLSLKTRGPGIILKTSRSVSESFLRSLREPFWGIPKARSGLIGFGVFFVLLLHLGQHPQRLWGTRLSGEVWSKLGTCKHRQKSSAHTRNSKGHL